MTVAVGLAVAAALVVLAAVLVVRVVAAGPVVRPVAWALGLAAALLGITAGLVALVVDGAVPAVVDAPVLRWAVVHRAPPVTTAAEVLSFVGGTVPTAALGLGGAVLLAVHGRAHRALVWATAVAVGSITIPGLKFAVQRPRPPETARLAVESTASLPSGHALMAALGVGLAVLAVLAVGTSRTGPRVTMVLVGALLVVAIGASRVILGVHWASDVLAGWALGAALTALAVAIATLAEGRTGNLRRSERARRSRIR